MERQHATLMTLWTFHFVCCMMTEHQTFSMHPLINFHRSNNRHTRQRPKPRFHSTQKCHYFASIVAFAALQLPLWSAVFLVSVQPPFWCSSDFYRCSTVAVSVGRWQLVARISSRIGRIFRKYSDQSWSTDQHTAEITRLKLKAPNRMVVPHNDSTMWWIYGVQVEQLLWRLFTAALRFIMGYLVLNRNFKVASWHTPVYWLTHSISRNRFQPGASKWCAPGCRVNDINCSLKAARTTSLKEDKPNEIKVGSWRANGRRQGWRGNQHKKWADLLNIKKNRLNDLIFIDGESEGKWWSEGRKVIGHGVMTNGP